MTFMVTDLQSTEPDELTKVDGIRVYVSVELDSMGFNRVDVQGPTAEAVIDYVRANWGDDDPSWFDEWVVQRVDEFKPTPAPPTTRSMLTVRFDVTDLTEAERGALALEVAVQAEASDFVGDDGHGWTGHRGVDAPEIEWDEVEVDA